MVSIKKSAKKKAFTLVELLVVIAILAVLATVSIVGYTQFIKKADLSVDEQFVTQMNKILEGEEVSGKPTNVYAAQDVLKKNGVNTFDATYVMNDFYWVGSENRVIIWTKDSLDEPESGKVTFPKKYARQLNASDITPATADWKKLNSVNYSSVTIAEATVDSLISAITQNRGSDKVIQLPKNQTISFDNAEDLNAFKTALSDGNESFDVAIDLNGGKIVNNTTDSVEVPVGSTLELSGGEASFDTQVASKSGLSPKSGSTLVLRNMTLDFGSGAGVYPSGDAAELIIDNCRIKAEIYAVATNRAASSNQKIVIKNSYLITGATTVLLNTPHKVSIENSTIVGGEHALAIRAGSAHVVDSSLKTTSTNPLLFAYKNFPNAAEGFDSWKGGWSQGNAMPAATVVLGDYSKPNANNPKPYSGDVICTFENVKLESANAEEIPTVLCAAKDEDKNVTFSYDSDSSVGDIVKYGDNYQNLFGRQYTFNNAGTIKVNGEKINQ